MSRRKGLRSTGTLRGPTTMKPMPWALVTGSSAKFLGTPQRRYGKRSNVQVWLFDVGSFAYFAMIANKRGLVIDAAPIARRWIGKHIHEVVRKHRVMYGA